MFGLGALVSRLASYTSETAATSRQHGEAEGSPLLSALQSLSDSAADRPGPPPADTAAAPGSPGRLEAGLAGPAPTSPDGASSLADAAARHRLTAGQQLDIRAVARAIEKNLPFGALFAFVFVCAHLKGILLVGWATFVLHRTNCVVRQQVALKEEVQGRALLGAVLVLTVHAKLLVVLGPEPPVWKLLMLQGGKGVATGFWDVLFAVTVCDLFMRYVLAIFKVKTECHCVPGVC
jgi:hypothetical protein